jgi:septal ring-binding cell division protein DamX
LQQPVPPAPAPAPEPAAAPAPQQLPAIYATVPPVEAAESPAGESAADTRDNAVNAPDWQQLAYRPAHVIPLKDLPSGFYTVQIVAMSSMEALESFRHAHGLDGVLGARIESGGRIFYALLLGVYETLADARAAAAARPASLQSYQPWIRKLDTLKAAVARADALANAAVR